MKKFFQEVWEYVKAYPPLAIIFISSLVFSAGIFVGMMANGDNFFAALISSAILGLFFFMGVTSPLMERNRRKDNEEKEESEVKDEKEIAG